MCSGRRILREWLRQVWHDTPWKFLVRRNARCVALTVALNALFGAIFSLPLSKRIT